MLTATILSATNLHSNAACQFRGNFHLLVSTDLNQPLSEWATAATNIINNRTNNIFTAALTNAVSSANQQFYILQSQ